MRATGRAGRARRITAALASGVLITGVGAASVPASAATVAWEPAANGQELLRFTGIGTELWGPQRPRFEGSTLVFPANRGAGEQPRKFSLSPGSDLPREAALLSAEHQELGRLTTSNGAFTTTKSGDNSIVHRISGGRSQALVSIPGEVVPVLDWGDRLVLKTPYDEVRVLTLATGDITSIDDNVSVSHVVGDAVWISRNTVGAGARWTRWGPTGQRTVVNGVEGQELAAGLGNFRGMVRYEGGIVVAAQHAVHRTELWFVAEDGLTPPALLTNVNEATAGTGATIRILGVLGGRVWFVRGAEVMSVSKTFGDVRSEMALAQDGMLPLGVTGGRAVAFEQGRGLVAIQPGAQAPTLLAGGDMVSATEAHDASKRFVLMRQAGVERVVSTDGTPAGTAVVPGGSASEYTFAGSSLRADLVTGAGGQLAFRQRGQGAQQLFLRRPDRTVRLLSLSVPSEQRQPKGKVAVKVKARAGEKVSTTVTGSIKVPGRKAIALKKVVVTGAKDRSATATLTTKKSQRVAVTKAVSKYRATTKKALKKKRAVVATVKVVVRDANAGNTVTRTFKVRLR